LSIGSGIGTYTRHLLAALARRSDVEVVVLCNAGDELPAGVQRRAIRRMTNRIVRRPRAHLIEHSIRMPVELHRSRPDGAVFHNPSFHAPLGVAAPWVQTLHDVIPLVFDAPDQAHLRARWRRFGPRYRSAGAVIAVSRHAADEGIHHLGLDPTRVHVAYHGVDPSFRPPSHEQGEGSGDRPYLLVVSEYSHRKGFAEAFALIDDLADAGYPHRLVVAGRIHEWIAHDLAGLRARAGHPERIEMRGYVPDLVRLYQRAAVFISSSRYEGFGLPALEAMACGAPVVAFANSAVTEVVGGGGYLVPDGDVGAMAAAVRALLDNPAASAEHASLGIEHARRFTWDASAALHVEAYRAALAHSPKRGHRK